MFIDVNGSIVQCLHFKNESLHAAYPGVLSRHEISRKPGAVPNVRLLFRKITAGKNALKCTGIYFMALP